jgi:hypothetical protein
MNEVTNYEKSLSGIAAIWNFFWARYFFSVVEPASNTRSGVGKISTVA